MSFEQLKIPAKNICIPGLNRLIELINLTRKQLGALAALEKNMGDLKETEEIVHDGITFRVKYVKKEELAPKLGIAFHEILSNHDTEEHELPHCAEVRVDLPNHIKRFVRSHELYHLIDESDAGGWTGSELRANLIPGMRDPIGLLATIKATLQDQERRAVYSKKIKATISNALFGA